MTNTGYSVNKSFDWLSEENSYSDWLIVNTGCKKTASDWSIEYRKIPYTKKHLFV